MIGQPSWPFPVKSELFQTASCSKLGCFALLVPQLRRTEPSVCTSAALPACDRARSTLGSSREISDTGAASCLRQRLHGADIGRQQLSWKMLLQHLHMQRNETTGKTVQVFVRWRSDTLSGRACEGRGAVPLACRAPSSDSHWKMISCPACKGASKKGWQISSVTNKLLTPFSPGLT